MTQRHGLASDDDGQGIFHFGFSYLVNHFQQSQERMDIELVALAQKHRSTIFLLDRAAPVLRGMRRDPLRGPPSLGDG